MLTKQQFMEDHSMIGIEGYDPRKTETRRLGWLSLKPGDILCGVEKAQGMPKGGKVNRLGLIEVVAVRRERLDSITSKAVKAEGFPGMTTPEFVEMFCRHNQCSSSTDITVIVFRHRAA